MTIEEHIELAFRAGFALGAKRGLSADRDAYWQDYKKGHFGTEALNWSFADAMSKRS